MVKHCYLNKIEKKMLRTGLRFRTEKTYLSLYASTYPAWLARESLTVGPADPLVRFD